MSARIGRNIFSLGISRIISGVILFFVYVRAITYLGPDEFGKFSLVLAYYTIFLLLVDFGISKYVIKKVSEDKTLSSTYLGNYVLVQFVLGLVVFVLFYLIPRLLSYELDVTQSMVIAGFGLLVTSISIPYSAIIQAWQRIGVIAVVNFLSTMVNAVWLVLAMALHKNVQFIFLLYVIQGVLTVAIYAYYARQHAALWIGKDFRLIKSLLWSGAPFAVITGFEMLIQKIDIIIQKHFLPYAEVGLYSGAYRFVDFLTFIPAVVSISLFPYIAERLQLKTSEVKDMLSHVNRYLVAIAVPLGVGATLASDKIILTLFDQRFLGSVRPFQILVWASSLTLVFAVPNVIMLVKKTTVALWVLAAATVFNAAANWFLVPRFGIIASAWITIVSYILVASLYIYFSKKEADFDLFRYFGWPIAASGIMGGVIWLARNLDIFSITAISLVVYFGILYLVRFITKDDLRYIKSLLRREAT